MTLIGDLREFLGTPDGRRVAVVGIGSPIRGDDSVGLEIVDRLEEYSGESLLIVKAETVPESFTGTVRDFEPTHVLMVDAANFNGAPGEARMIPLEAIGGSSISTHSLPLSVFANFIKKTVCPNVALVGIQVINITLGAEITPEVLQEATTIADTIIEALEN